MFWTCHILGGHGNQLMYGPPGPGGHFKLLFGISNDKICRILSLDNDLRHLILQTETSRPICYRGFPLETFSCKENVRVWVKLIHFLVGFG